MMGRMNAAKSKCKIKLVSLRKYKMYPTIISLPGCLLGTVLVVESQSMRNWHLTREVFQRAMSDTSRTDRHTMHTLNILLVMAVQ